MNEMNDKTEQALTDALIDQIESAARESFRRHQGSIKGQILTAADNYDWHLLHAAYQAGHAAAQAETAAAVAKERERATEVLASFIPEWDGQEAVDGGYLIRMLIDAIRAGAKETSDA